MVISAFFCLINFHIDYFLFLNGYGLYISNKLLVFQLLKVRDNGLNTTLFISNLPNYVYQGIPNPCCFVMLCILPMDK